MISNEDSYEFVDRALDGMITTIVTGLGERAAEISRSNAGCELHPYAVLSHCLGVIEYSAGISSPAAPSSATATLSSLHREA